MPPAGPHEPRAAPTWAGTHPTREAKSLHGHRPTWHRNTVAENATSHRTNRWLVGTAVERALALASDHFLPVAFAVASAVLVAKIR